MATSIWVGLNTSGGFIPDGTDVSAVRNGANGQAVRIYNTYTDAANYERAELVWTANVFKIQTTALGTGTQRELRLDAPGAGGFVAIYTGTALRLQITSGGAVLAISSSGGLGYGTGAGGSVAQATSKAQGVALNTVTGQITLNGASLGAGVKVSFVVTNTSITALDGVVAWINSGGTANAYRVDVTAIAAGSFTLTVENLTAGALLESPVIGYAIIKSVIT